MTNLIKFDGFDGSEIRVTDDGRYSVFDVIAFCGKKSQSEVWKRLCVHFPEVVATTEEFQFPGRGQRKTPVAKENVVLEILTFFGKAPGQSVFASDKFYPRTETQIIGVLVEAFSDCEPCPQFYCSGYRIDLYLAKHRIAIECDEQGHGHYNQKNERKREQAIKSALGCSFVRFNPYSDDFNIGRVIKQIRALV